MEILSSEPDAEWGMEGHEISESYVIGGEAQWAFEWGLESSKECQQKQRIAEQRGREGMIMIQTEDDISINCRGT